MKNVEIKHSVLMVTYNQEDYIENALKSVLSQDVLPYEIVISDDASNDGTWEIIEAYKLKYPEIIKASRNKVNLGVYGNFNMVLKKATGDVVSWLSGDDCLKNGLFSELNRIIHDNAINYKSEKFIIVTNFEFEFANSRKKTFDNYQLREMSIFKQRVRYGIFYRMIGIGRRILDDIDLSRTDIGVHADWLLDLDIESKCDSFYFTPFISSTYKAGIGIVSRTKSKEMYLSRLKAIDIIIEKYFSKLDDRDISFLDYERKLNLYLIDDNFQSYLIMLCAFFKNFNNFPVNNPAYSIERILTLLPPKFRIVLKSIRNQLFNKFQK